MTEANLKLIFPHIVKMKGGAASSLLAGSSVYSGAWAKEFVPPFDYWVSLVVSVGAGVGFSLLAIIALKAVFSRGEVTPQESQS